MDLLLTLIVLLVVIGLALYVVSLLPIDQRIKLIITCLLVLVAIIWLLRASGMLAGDMSLD